MDVEGFEADAIQGSMQVAFFYCVIIASLYFLYAMQLLLNHRVSNILVEIKSDDDRFPPSS